MYSARFTSEIIGGGFAETRADYFSADPLVLHMEFTQHYDGAVIRWQFGRDLLLTGMTSTEWIGQGDVQVARGEQIGGLGEDVLQIALDTPSGRGVLLLPLVDLSRFLGRTLVEMPLGDELVDTDGLLGSETSDFVD